MIEVHIREINIIMSAVATTASLFVLFETWRRRHVQGALWFGALVAAISWMSLWYVFEAVGGDNVDAYTAFSKIEYIGLTFIPLTWMGFALTFADRERILTRPLVFLLAIVPLITIALVFTNEWHGLIWKTAHFEAGERGPIFAPEYGTWFWIYIMYSYGLFTIGTAVLIRQSLKKWRIYRAQALLFLIGTLLPWLSNLLSIFDNLNPVPELYWNAIFLSSAMVAFTFGLFRLRLLDVMPLAYDTILNHIPDGLMVTDTQDRIIAINQDATRYLSGEKIIGEPISIVFPLFEDAFTALKTAPHTRYEWQFEEQVIEVRVSSVFDKRNRNRGNLYILRDITERKRAEEALQESEARYRSVVTSLSEGVVLHGSSGAIQATNEAAERILGLTTAQMTGRTSIDPRWRAIHEDGSSFPGETHPVMVTLQTGEAVTNVVMGVHKPDGDLTWILVNSQPIVVDGSTHAVVASFTDITERKQAESRQLELALEKERTNLLFNFIQDASHEFRTPLSIIHSSAYLAGKTDNPEIKQQKLHQIVEQAKRITQLVEKLVEMSRLDSRIHLTCRPTSVNQIVEQVTQQIQPMVTAKGLIFEMRLDECVPSINASAELLINALYHILDNAIKHTPSDGCVCISTRYQDDLISIEVRDTGCGIAPSQIPFIFNRFYRLDTAHTTPGLGLGLPIAQKIVGLHGGRIEVESRENMGSVFRVVLPNY
jgi:PAS domain S-box-containing protein